VSARELWSGIGFGLVASLAGAVAYHACAPWLGAALAIRAVIILLALATALWILQRSRARVGRVVAFLAWLVLLGALVVFDPRLWLWLLALTLACWLTRSLYRYQHLTQALIDAVLAGFALMAAIVALRSSQSLFLALWSYYLVQSLTALIPAGSAEADAAPPEEDPFERAQRSADAALRRLATHS
jgi:hypothetical protein